MEKSRKIHKALFLNFFNYNTNIEQYKGYYGNFVIFCLVLVWIKQETTQKILYCPLISNIKQYKLMLYLNHLYGVVLIYESNGPKSEIYTSNIPSYHKLRQHPDHYPQQSSLSTKLLTCLPLLANKKRCFTSNNQTNASHKIKPILACILQMPLILMNAT